MGIRQRRAGPGDHVADLCGVGAVSRTTGRVIGADGETVDVDGSIDNVGVPVRVECRDVVGRVVAVFVAEGGEARVRNAIELGEVGAGGVHC